MRVKLQARVCRRDLCMSARIGGKILYVCGRQIHVKSAVDLDKSTAIGGVFEEDISGIAVHQSSLVLLFGNMLRTYVVGVDSLCEVDRAMLLDIPISVRNCGDALVLLFADNRLQVKRRLLHTVDVVADYARGGAVSLVDMCDHGDRMYWLAGDGRVFETECLREQRFLRLGRPLLMLPCAADAGYEHVAVADTVAAVAGRGHCSVYRRCGRALVLKYTYAGRVGGIQRYRESIFCVGDGLLRMDDAPELVLEGRAERFFGDIAIFSDRVAFIEEEAVPVCERGELVLLHEQGACARAERLLAPVLRFDLAGVLGAHGGTQEDALQRVAGELSVMYNDIYIELRTLEESFCEKERVLGLKYRELVRSVDAIDERKACVVRKQNDLILGAERLWAGIRCDVDAGSAMAGIARARESIARMAPQRNGAFLRVLRAQRSALESRMRVHRQ